MKNDLKNDQEFEKASKMLASNKLDPVEEAKWLLIRGNIYKKRSEYKMACDDYDRAIDLPINTKVDFGIATKLNLFIARSDCYGRLSDYIDAAIDYLDICKLIPDLAKELGWKSQKSEEEFIEYEQKKFEDKAELMFALHDIKKDRYNTLAFENMAERYLKRGEVKEAFRLLNEALTFIPNCVRLYAMKGQFLTYISENIDFRDISDFIDEMEYIESEGEHIESVSYDCFYYAIENDPTNPEYLVYRGYNRMNLWYDFEGAIEDFDCYYELIEKLGQEDRSIILYPGKTLPKGSVNFLLALCHLPEGNKEKAHFHFNKWIKGNPQIDETLKLLDAGRGIVDINESTSFASISSEGSIELLCLTLELFFQIGDTNLIKDTIECAKMVDKLDFHKNSNEIEKETKIDDIFSSYPDFNGDLAYILKRDGETTFKNKAKKCFLYYLLKISKVNLSDYEYYYNDIEETEFAKVPKKDIENMKTLIRKYEMINEISLKIDSMLAKQQIKLIEQHKQEKIEERNKVIANLSHSIKNLISSVIDPLESLKREQNYEQQTVINALRGTNLVREMVQAMNLSYVGSIDDFYYDAHHNQDEDALGFEDIILQSIRYSIPHMFDGKYFNKFTRAYFQDKQQFVSAKSEWENIDESNRSEMILPFLEKHFFKIDLSFENIKNLKIGNEKGSSIKLLILFQELLLNAVKYSAFIEKQDRFINADLLASKDSICFTINNRYKDSLNIKSSGIGTVIIQNFCDLMEAEINISKEKGIYSVVANFKNFWKEGK
jgi:tetratricopeptide (TPR) repeat protein